MTNCVSDGNETKDTCSCIYDLADETLDPDTFKFFILAATGKLNDPAEEAKIKAEYGMFETLAMLSAISRLEGASKAVCRPT